ncbi:MAG: KOW domain-containing RNA-binding protein [Peptococcaceae bacterium]
MKEEEFVPGRLVCSEAGRDRGKYYLIWNVINETMVQVVNGKERKISGPKKKNIKHLKICPFAAGELFLIEINAKRRVTDADIRKKLSEIPARQVDK